MRYTPATPLQATTSHAALVACFTDPFNWVAMGHPSTYTRACKENDCFGMVNAMRAAITPALAQWLAARPFRCMLLASACLGYGGNYGVMPQQWPGLPRNLLRAATWAAGVFAMP